MQIAISHNEHAVIWTYFLLSGIVFKMAQKKLRRYRYDLEIEELKKKDAI